MSLIELLQHARTNGDKCLFVLYYELHASGVQGLSNAHIRERFGQCRIKKHKIINISDALSKSNHLVDRSRVGTVHLWRLTPSGIEKVRAKLLSYLGKVPEIGTKSNQIMISKPISVLFLGLAPIDADRIRIDKETREIEEKIRASEFRDSFRFYSKWAVRTKDLFLHIHENRPDILHISGHGSELGEIAFEDDAGKTRLVSPTILSQALGSIDSNLKVALFNLCYSNNAAKELSQHIDCAIGMSGPINDESAIVFASSFYMSLGFGKSVVQAFREARAAVILEGLPDDNVLELNVRKGVEPDELHFK